MTELDEKQKKFLRGLAHPKEPVARTGQAGLTESLLQEIAVQLLAHELIKLKVSAPDRGTRDALIGEVCAKSGATLVQRIGNIAILYKKHPTKPKIELPK
jgi:RNA-binding protein